MALSGESNELYCFCTYSEERIVECYANNGISSLKPFRPRAGRIPAPAAWYNGHIRQERTPDI